MQLVGAPSTLAWLRRRFIIMPWHKGRWSGHPVIVSAAVRPEFFEAETAREVIYQIPQRIRVVNVRTTSIFEDFSTLESYEECLAQIRSSQTLKRFR